MIILYQGINDSLKQESPQNIIRQVSMRNYSSYKVCGEEGSDGLRALVDLSRTSIYQVVYLAPVDCLFGRILRNREAS